MLSSSRAKNTGWNGEFLFSVSISIDDSVSEAMGSEGTGTGSRTGSGGVGGLEPPAEVAGGGETGGRATGGFFFPHAPVTTSAVNARTTTIRLCFIVSAFSLGVLPFAFLTGRDFVPRSTAGA